MGRETSLNFSAIAVLIGGALALLFTFYFMQQLSYSIGIYSGISSTIKAYNITNSTISSVLLTTLSQSTTLVLALHLTYALLPFALLIFALGIIWLFSRSFAKFTGSMLLISSMIYIILTAILQFDFSFKNAPYAFPLAYLGAIVAIAVSLYSTWKADSKQHTSKRPVAHISINPDTPYSNMKILSNRLMRKLSGEIKILDMHFDVGALDNLMMLIDRNTDQYSKICVLTKPDRLGDEFEKSFTDFRNELSNRKVEFELRVLDQSQSSKQHERILMDDRTAYKIPPLNIINRKSEHIVGINHDEASRRFDGLWAEARKFENLKSQT